MAKDRSNELTMVFSQLNRREATNLKGSLMETKKTYAPNAKASIQVGKRENFQSIMQRCKHHLNG